MRDHRSLPRRSPDSVLGLAALVGAGSAVPAALLALPASSLVRAVAAGAGPGPALRAAGMTGEDWELVPVFVMGAVLAGAVVAVITAIVWSLLSDRRPDRPWLARVGAVLTAAALAAAAVPVLLLTSNTALTVAAGVTAGLVALVAAPRVGYTAAEPAPVPAG